ncbi:MAG TPA: RNA polymerase sigma factor, partial [Pyrinomonadaceae bacterium]
YTWLRRITINTFLNHQRSNSSRPGQSITVEPDCAELASALASEQSIYNKVLFGTVLGALAELTPPQRLIFLLRHYEGMSYDEIATAMSCSTGTAKKSVWRALGKLRAKLNVSNANASDESVVRLAAEY